MLLMVMTDGRLDCLSRTIASAEEKLINGVTTRVIHDDTGDAKYRKSLVEQFPDYEVIGGPHRRGFGGAISNAWKYVLSTDESYVFHLEDDFVFNEEIHLDRISDLLANRTYLIQVALKRQAWNQDEINAGGIVETDPASFEEVVSGGEVWTEHKKFFTTNPCVYRSSLCQHGWPEGNESEGKFGISLKSEFPDHKFAFWGGKYDKPMVTHIGKTRKGVGY